MTSNGKIEAHAEDVIIETQESLPFKRKVIEAMQAGAARQREHWYDGHKLLQAMDALKLDQNEVRKRCGYSSSAASNWRSRKKSKIAPMLLRQIRDHYPKVIAQYEKMFGVPGEPAAAAAPPATQGTWALDQALELLAENPVFRAAMARAVRKAGGAA